MSLGVLIVDHDVIHLIPLINSPILSAHREPMGVPNDIRRTLPIAGRPWIDQGLQVRLSRQSPE